MPHSAKSDAFASATSSAGNALQLKSSRDGQNIPLDLLYRPRRIDHNALVPAGVSNNRRCRGGANGCGIYYTTRALADSSAIFALPSAITRSKSFSWASRLMCGRGAPSFCPCRRRLGWVTVC